MNQKKRTRSIKQANIAFMDAEYTCSLQKTDRPQEVLSIGIIICSSDYQELKRYYSVIHPEFKSELTDYCKELTGLQQEEIDAALNYEFVMKIVTALLEQYEVGRIYVWGSDRAVFKRDLEANHPGISEELKAKCSGMISKIRDVENTISALICKNVLSIATMKYVCGFENCVSHNAMKDAEDLWKVMGAIKEKRYSEERVQTVKRYMDARERYHRNRRFWEKSNSNIGDNPICISITDMGRNYAHRLIECHVPEIMAIRDDILVLHGGSAIGFPRLEEYVMMEVSKTYRNSVHCNI